jgi:signal transduction histidine kinase
MGEGETVDSVEGGGDKEIDAQSLLGDLIPKVYDPKGQPVPPIEDSKLLGRIPQAEVPGNVTGRLPANLSRQGQEWQWLVNGEIVQRDAFQFIEIKYPGGKQILSFRRSDIKDWDRSVLDTNPRVERVVNVYRPSSRRITIAWDSTIDGKPVTMSAGIDSSVLEEGISELRRRTIPKVLAGAAAFLALLGLAYFYVFRLLGEARRMEAESSQQALLAQVGMLAAGLAHEIRNPLSAVQMNLQLLEEDLEDAPPPPPAPAAASSSLSSARPVGAPEHVALLHATQREIRRLGTLVSDFLTYARPTTPRPAPVRLDALVRDCVELFRATAEGLGVRLDLDLQAGDDPISLDEAMVKQALMNVLKNAIEAVPQPGGRVSVATRRGADVAQVSVSDNGPGVPADPEAMFRVFHSTKKGGTGLGLPISRALAERQRGTLVARPRAQGGAVFVLSLPTTAAAPSPAPASAEAAAS